MSRGDADQRTVAGGIKAKTSLEIVKELADENVELLEKVETALVEYKVTKDNDLTQRAQDREILLEVRSFLNDLKSADLVRIAVHKTRTERDIAVAEAGAEVAVAKWNSLTTFVRNPVAVAAVGTPVVTIVYYASQWAAWYLGIDLPFLPPGH